jgi:hypothetical protein
LRSLHEGGREDKRKEVEPWQGTRARHQSKDVDEDAKRRKKTSMELLFPTIEEINQSFIWDQDYVSKL